MSVLWAFFKRDARIFLSYRVGVLLRVVSFVFTLAPFFFIAKLMSPYAIPALEPYGGEFFPFVLIGLAFSRYVGVSLSGLSGALREEQLQGTLEALLVTPTALVRLFVGNLLWDFVWTTFEVCIFLIIGVVIFGVNVSINGFAVVCVLVATFICFMGLGVMSASAVLVFREADPVNWAVGGVMKLLGGVYFPLAVLPDGLQQLAQWIPLTHALEGLRKAVLLGGTVFDVSHHCFVLFGFSLLFWPCAMLSLSCAMRVLRESGSLNFR